MSLIRGYQVVTPKSTEILFAVDGHRIFKSDEHKISSSFDTKARTWERVYEMPADACFIGNYPMPKNITRFA